MKENIKKISLFFYLFIAVSVIIGCDNRTGQALTQKAQKPFVPDDIELIAQAYENGQSNIFVESKGKVEKLLNDDLNAPRHQKFIIRLSDGHTLLINHNIDLAPRIEGLNIGDEVRFRGEYIWNHKGGSIHYTHRDPDGKKLGGFIEYQGKRYE